MKAKQSLVNEFSIEELESRLEMKGWLSIEACDDASHCHPVEEQQ
ncbi:hypothetical protein [Flavobacterium foetidum]|nr:hypothetical protein [Flavobacterium foetidum]